MLVNFPDHLKKNCCIPNENLKWYTWTFLQSLRQTCQDWLADGSDSLSLLSDGKQSSSHIFSSGVPPYK